MLTLASNIACLHSLGELQVGRQRMLHLKKSVTTMTKVVKT